MCNPPSFIMTRAHFQVEAQWSHRHIPLCNYFAGQPAQSETHLVNYWGGMASTGLDKWYIPESAISQQDSSNRRSAKELPCSCMLSLNYSNGTQVFSRYPCAWLTVLPILMALRPMSGLRRMVPDVQDEDVLHHLISQAGWNRCNLSIYLSRQKILFFQDGSGRGRPQDIGVYALR